MDRQVAGGTYNSPATSALTMKIKVTQRIDELGADPGETRDVDVETAKRLLNEGRAIALAEKPSDRRETRESRRPTDEDTEHRSGVGAQ